MAPLAPVVFLLHGLGPAMIVGWSLLPLKVYLKYQAGFNETHILRYPVNTMGVDEMVDFVDAEMSKLADKTSDSVILVGQSMGGVIANRMHTKGWKIRKAVYIGSPMHGARLLNILDDLLPTRIRDFMFKKPYGFLMEKDRDEEPPHAYHTISMAWPFTDFDGCVFRDEVVLSETNHTHLRFADHRTVFLNPRLWWRVGKILTEG